MPDANDMELVREFAQQHSEAAFTELVRRHINLVYSVALRCTGDSGDAQDVTQAVFIILARKAAGLRERTLLTGWLYETTRFTAARLLRTNARRHAREQEAYMQSTLTGGGDAPSSSTSQEIWTQLSPHLEAAMSRLAERDRALLVLRFYENKSGPEAAALLGIREDAAHKRVTRAIEKLRKFFAQRGVTLSGAAIIGAVSANSVQAAPAGLIAMISSSVLSGTTITTAAVIAATKTIAMTTLQKTLVSAALVATIGAGIFEAHQNSQLRAQNQTLQQQQAPLTAQIQQLSQALTDATNRLAGLLAENDQLKSHSNENELLKLRGEVGRLRNNTTNPTEVAAEAWLTKVNKLKQRLEEMPNAKIPELQFLTEQAWLSAATSKLNSDANYRYALATLRSSGETAFANMVQSALQNYSQANNGQFPTDLTQLQSYFNSPVDETILQRWEIVPAKDIKYATITGDWAITQKALPVDDVFDQRLAINANSRATSDFLTSEINSVMPPVYKAFTDANNGKNITDFSQLLPYATTPEQQAALQKMMLQEAGRK
jgi:RNA polymerase sigma factor (sigma-70 family)